MAGELETATHVLTLDGEGNVCTVPASTGAANEVLEEDHAVADNYEIDWTKETYYLTMVDDTVFTETNLPAVGTTKEIKLYLTGNFVPTFPAGWTTNLVGSYKGADVNEVVVKYIKAGVYFVRINNSLTPYPAPILGSVIPVSLLPDSTSELRLKGSFFTPEGFVLIDGQVVNSIEFEPDTGDYILEVDTGSIEGEFNITISNGTSVTFSGALLVNQGEVFIPEQADWGNITGNIDLTQTGSAKLATQNVQGKAEAFLIPENANFEIRFVFDKSILEPTPYASNFSYDRIGVIRADNSANHFSVGFRYGVNQIAYFDKTSNVISGYKPNEDAGVSVEPWPMLKIRRINNIISVINPTDVSIYSQAQENVGDLILRAQVSEIDIKNIKLIMLP